MTVTGAPRVLISVVNHAGADYFSRCIDSLPAACAGVEWHIVVVDNCAPGHRTIEAQSTIGAERCSILMNVRTRGFGANHNAALRNHMEGWKPDYVLILNDDTLLPPGLVHRMVASLEQTPGAALLAPAQADAAGQSLSVVLPYPSLGQHIGRTFRRPPCLHGREVIPDTHWPNGACWLVAAPRWQELGGFDESFHMFCEDTDAARRLQTRGWALVYDAQLQIVHLNHATVSSDAISTGMGVLALESRYRFLRKHSGRYRADFDWYLHKFILAVRLARRHARRRRHAGDYRHLVRLISAKRPL